MAIKVNRLHIKWLAEQTVVLSFYSDHFNSSQKASPAKFLNFQVLPTAFLLASHLLFFSFAGSHAKSDGADGSTLFQLKSC